MSEKGLRYEASYQYNAQNRMVYSVATSHVEKMHTVNSYGYTAGRDSAHYILPISARPVGTHDALGRRTLTQSVTGETLRTLYDGKGFEVIREGESFRDGSFTTRYSTNSAMLNGTGTLVSYQATGERYRWIGDSSNGRTISEDGYTVTGSRYGARGVTLYGKGEAVAMSSSNGSRTMYLGKDVIGSVRSVTVDTGSLEDRYEYDAFGQPYKGDLGKGMNLGYTGKPYDTSTGLYNYGYRDYKPQAARFTTADPVRDGSNWFAYTAGRVSAHYILPISARPVGTHVRNDPVNWVDLWGLETYTNSTTIFRIIPTEGPSGKIPGMGSLVGTTVTTNVTTTIGSNTMTVSSYSTSGPTEYGASATTTVVVINNGVVVATGTLTTDKPALLPAGHINLGEATINVPGGVPASGMEVTTMTTFSMPADIGWYPPMNVPVTVKIECKN